MTNYAFRYMAEEILASAEIIEHLKSVWTLPIEEAEATDDELCEDITEGLDQ